MILTLPSRSGAPALEINTSRLTVIGANGAGKTRFARALAASLGERAFAMSALRALYDREAPASPAPGSIDSLYAEAVGRSALVRPDRLGEFDRLTALLVGEAVGALMSERYEAGVSAGPVRLDTVIDRWERLFPGNRILVQYGRLLVDSSPAAPGSAAYSAARLSDGERAVLYYLAAVLYAPAGGVVFVESPEMFLHASVVRRLWDDVERLRPDCTFVYITHDLAFAATRADSDIIWVKSCDTERGTWDYDRLAAAEGLPDDVYLAILGERRPVLFVEGDGVHSFDAKLYPLIFPEFTVKPIGGCKQVIEATRSFNGLRTFHNLDAYGIVDRDRRADAEVAYLRRRHVLVPDVAEIENIFLIEPVVRIMAEIGGRRPGKVFDAVRSNLLHLFRSQLRRQALEHTRHRLKKEVAVRIDGRFDTVEALEKHVSTLLLTLNPRGIYGSLRREFTSYAEGGDYASILRVFNHKSMITETRVAQLCGMRDCDKRAYIGAVLDMLRTDRPEAEAMRAAMRDTFKL